jgi:hypothetical protein
LSNKVIQTSFSLSVFSDILLNNFAAHQDEFVRSRIWAAQELIHVRERNTQAEIGAERERDKRQRPERGRDRDRDTETEKETAMDLE